VRPRVEVAVETSCPLQLGLLAECLREKDVRSLLNIQVEVPLLTAFPLKGTLA
jgi:hypothetical protein